MNNIINITNNNNELYVDARELHNALGVARDFSTWIKSMIDYGFEETSDYIVFTNFGENPKGGRPRKEYALKIDMAKEIAMIQRSELGRQVRKYFIQCEKDLKEERKSKAMKYDMFVEKDNTFGFRELRKELESALHIKIKENQFKRLLAYELGWITNHNRIKPTSKGVRGGYIVIKDTIGELDSSYAIIDTRFSMKARDCLVEELIKYYDLIV